MIVIIFINYLTARQMPKEPLLGGFLLYIRQQIRHNNPKVITCGVTYNAGSKTRDERSAILHGRRSHRHKWRGVDKRHRRDYHRIGIHLHQSAQNGMYQERQKYRHRHKGNLINTSGQIEIRKISHRGDDHAEYIYKVHAYIVATLQDAHPLDE